MALILSPPSACESIKQRCIVDSSIVYRRCSVELWASNVVIKFPEIPLNTIIGTTIYT